MKSKIYDNMKNKTLDKQVAYPVLMTKHIEGSKNVTKFGKKERRIP